MVPGGYGSPRSPAYAPAYTPRGSEYYSDPVSPGYPQRQAHLDGDMTVEYQGDHRRPKRRGNLPRPVTEFLRGWYFEHIDNPYPTEDEKQIFMHHTGLNLTQINNWFINARRRMGSGVRSVRADDVGSNRDERDVI
ncbi:MAG: hypothetical protein M1833_007253 [Piccolia ochrophora]|nr:MAG: hypothetical protein M1833_007253 [Piccolia ochrophora]